MHPRVFAASDPERPAAIIAETGEALSYGTLERRANQGAQLLRVHDAFETVQALRVWRGLRDTALSF